MPLVPMVINNTFVLRQTQTNDCIPYNRGEIRVHLARWKQLHVDNDPQRRWVPTEEELVNIEYLFNAAYPCLRKFAPLHVTYEPW